MADHMLQWHEVEESEVRCWVLDLDPNLYSVNHRRLCAWQDDADGQWHWGLETFSGTGEAASGIESSLGNAQEAAYRAAAQYSKR
jgi:hypothetical protein